MERCGSVAPDVPPTADLAQVQRLLDFGVAEEGWATQEGVSPRIGEPPPHRLTPLPRSGGRG